MKTFITNYDPNQPQIKIEKELLELHNTNYDKCHNFGQTLRIVCEWNQKMISFTIRTLWKSIY